MGTWFGTLSSLLAREQVFDEIDVEAQAGKPTSFKLLAGVWGGGGDSLVYGNWPTMRDLAIVQAINCLNIPADFARSARKEVIGRCAEREPHGWYGNKIFCRPFLHDVFRDVVKRKQHHGKDALVAVVLNDSKGWGCTCARFYLCESGV